MENRTVDVTPTWGSILPVLVAILTQGETEQARETAREELRRMAQLADLYVQSIKGGECPHLVTDSVDWEAVADMVRDVFETFDHEEDETDSKGVSVSAELIRWASFGLWLAKVERRIQTITAGQVEIEQVTHNWRELFDRSVSAQEAAEIALYDYGFTLDDGGES